MWVAFATAKTTHIFSAKIFKNDMLTNNIVGFEQLGSNILIMILISIYQLH